MKKRFTLVKIILVLVIILALASLAMILIFGDWQTPSNFLNRPVGELKVSEFFLIVILILIIFK